MKLYHYSNMNLEVLTPQFGNNRHNGEDPSVVGKLAIYLTTDTNTLFDGEPRKYRYTVDVDSNDPILKPDDAFNMAITEMNSLEVFDSITLWDDGDNISISISQPQIVPSQKRKQEIVDKWFAYFVDLVPIKKEVWNGESYVQI